MKNAIYVVKDHRPARERRRTLASLVDAYMNQGLDKKIDLTNAGSSWGVELGYDPEDPRFVDTEDLVSIPVGEGRVDLLRITPELFEELEVQLRLDKEEDWPELKDEDAIQDFLRNRFFAID